MTRRPRRTTPRNVSMLTAVASVRARPEEIQLGGFDLALLPYAEALREWVPKSRGPRVPDIHGWGADSRIRAHPTKCRHMHLVHKRKSPRVPSPRHRHCQRSLRLVHHLDSDTARTRSASASTSTPTPPAPAQSYPAPLPLTSTAWCGLVQGPALGSNRVPTRSAADECGEGVILVAVILVAVLNREIEASSGAAPEVVKTRDSGSRVVGDFRRVGVHQLVNQLDERKILGDHYEQQRVAPS